MLKNGNLKKILPLACLLVILTVLAVIAAVLSDNGNITDDSFSDTAQIVLLSFSETDVVHLEYTFEDINVSLLKNGDGWLADDYDNRIADSKTVEEMLTALSAVTAVRSVDGGKLSDFGFDDPVLCVEIVLKDGTKHEYRVGIKGTYKGYSYLCFDGKVYMFSDTLSDRFNVSVKEILGLSDTFPNTVSKGTLMSLTVTDKEGNTVTYSECGKMAEFIAAMKLTFKFHDLSKVDATSDELRTFGINESCTKISIFYNAPSESQPNLLVDSKFDLFVGNESDGTVYYVCSSSSNVYKGDKYRVNSLIDNMISHSEAHKTECVS